MAFITINADLSKVAESLKRIADKLDEVFPKPIVVDTEQSGLEDFSYLKYEKDKNSNEWESYAPRSNYR